MIKAIWAWSENKLIGKDNKMPWYIPEEFKHFSKTTMGHTILMGRTTFLNLPNNLPGRKNIILSPTNDIPGADIIINNEEELKKLFVEYKNSNKILFIAGGKCVYEKYAKYADEWIVSYVWGKYDGNVYLNLKMINYFKTSVVTKNSFDIVTYKKIIK